MNEDAGPIYRDEAAVILATMRHFGLNELQAETTEKASICRKQKIASVSTDYLDKVLAAGLSTAAKK